MAENLVEDKAIEKLEENSNENDLLNENKDKNNSNHTIDTNDNINDIKDEDESQDLKTSDLDICVPVLESESEKRCTSASNAGESEYESADDDQMDDNQDLSQTPDECQVGQCQPIDANVEKENFSVSDEVLNRTECEIKVNPLNDELTVEPQLELDKVELEVKSDKLGSKLNPDKVESEVISNKIVEQINNETNEDVISEMSENGFESNNDEKEVESKLNQIENIESKMDEKSNKNNCISDDVIDQNEADIVNETMTDINQDLIDEEGGHEEIAEMDDEEEYEDIEDSEECSDNSFDGDVDGLKETLDLKENEDLEGEREQGDGEESIDSQQNVKDKNVDHDEDKRNPQYIPKRGPFYEHDDRMSEKGAEEAVVEPEEPPKPIIIAKKPVEPEDDKKKQRRKQYNDSDRWGHDLFKVEEQVPKSKDELVNIYGYDIRNEDDPPKARRRRRYGRGPNKYTRQWQDENAYTKGKTSPEHNRSLRHEDNDDNERYDRSERLAKDRTDRNRDYNDRDRSRNDRDYDRDGPERERKRSSRVRSDRNTRLDRSSNEFSNRKVTQKNDNLIIERKIIENEENIVRRVEPFSTDDFPELPNNDLRKKLTSGSNEVWKSSSRNTVQSVHEVEDKHQKEFKTEPMKIIESIENNNRSANYNEINAGVVRTQTFENSKYSQRRSSGNFEFEDENRRRNRNRTNNESTGRAIRKTNDNLNYSDFSQVSSDNYRNRSNVRTERGFQEESNRTTERYYKEDSFRNQRDSNYISDPIVSLQKLPIDEKLNRNNETEQPRAKRYSSLRQQQQQRIPPESMANIISGPQVAQSGDSISINAHQFYDSHQIQTPAYYTETTAPRTAYHTYMASNAAETAPQTHPSNYLPQPIPTRYISQASASPGGEPNRYLPQTVTANVVTSSVSAAIPAIPQAGPPPPPSVMPGVAPPQPPGPQYIQSFPSGYPQFPPAPQPTHVPPGYPGHVPPPQPPTPLQLAELYRGGVTYYDTHSQQQQIIRQIPQRRPKAAIPIVPPPDQQSSDGDGDKAYVSVNS